jgi:hypothetical protein
MREDQHRAGSSVRVLAGVHVKPVRGGVAVLNVGDTFASLYGGRRQRERRLRIVLGLCGI